MYDLESLKSGMIPPGPPWGSPFVAENPNDGAWLRLEKAIEKSNLTPAIIVRKLRKYGRSQNV